MKRDEIRQRYEAFVGACIDIYGRVMEASGRTPTLTDVVSVSQRKDRKQRVATVLEEAKTSILALRTIFNQGMMDISKRYKCSVLQLSDKALELGRTKYHSIGGKKDDASTASSEPVAV
jgi:hypothetical protein